MRTRSTLLATVAFVVATGTAQAQVGGFPIIPNPGLPDAAMATFDPMGRPIILVNPGVLTQLGADFTRFTIAHEHVHHFHGHVVAALQGAPPEVRRAMELDADCTAARHLAGSGDLAAVQAAYTMFASQGPHAGSPLHPSGAQRAETIRACASGG